MKEVTIEGHKVVLYESINEMPIIRFHLYNKYLLIESGVGGDIDAVVQHLLKISKFVEVDDKKNAMIEINNTIQNIVFISNNLSPQRMAFCSLIYSIDDVVITDMSEEGLKKLSNELKKWGTSQSFIKTIFERIKKKNDEEMQFFFPEIQEQGKTREYLSFLKKRCLLLIDQILNNRFIQEEFKKIDEQLLKYANPNEFHGNNSIEINYEKRFTEMNVFIEALAKIDPLKKTVLEYYELLKFLKKNSKYLAHG